MKRVVSACALLLITAAAAFAQATAVPVKAIVGGTVVNLDGPAIPDAVVLIDGDKITAVGSAATTKVPAGAQVIRANGRWIMSGLFNMHVHLGLILPGVQGAELANESDAALGLRMAINARKSLLAGVTTVRLTGDPRHADFAVKAAVDRGEMDGPRIFPSGEIVRVTGGHGAAMGEDFSDGPYEFRKATRREIQAGATWIKIAISGGISDVHGDIAASHMTKDEMEAVTDIAHRHGIKVTAHSGSPLATDEAIDAGVDCIEHGYFLTPEVLRKMKARNVWLVPTIVVTTAGALEFFKRIGSPDWYLARVASAGKAHWTMLQTAIHEGVRIALGTDQFPYEPNDGTVATVREAQHYVEAGMTPTQALRAATIEPATLLGVADRSGSIQAGKYADLIMVPRDPTKDITALRSIQFVMKGGKVYRDDTGIRP
jgi:imidazolonepropionase-like amidohydrolase